MRNGALAVVVDVDPRGLDVRTADGRDLHLPYDYVADWVDHAYAMTVHKSQGRTLGEVDLGQGDRRHGHAFVYGAAGLGAEAALVAASRATDETDLYMLSVPPLAPTSHGRPEPVEPEVQLERAWSTSDAKTTAADIIASAEEIRRLAALPSDELHQRLSDLALLEPAQQRGLRGALDDAERRLGVAGAILAENSAGEGAEQARRDRAAALADVDYYRGRVDRRRQLLDERGGDLRAASVERDTLGQALRTQRRWRQTAVASEPPGWLTELLGQPPADDRGRAQLWWDAMSAALDIRHSRGIDDLKPAGQEGDSRWQRAIGVDPDSTEAMRWHSAIAVIRRARTELGPSRPPEARAVGESIAAERSRHLQEPAPRGLGRT